MTEQTLSMIHDGWKIAGPLLVILEIVVAVKIFQIIWGNQKIKWMRSIMPDDYYAIILKERGRRGAYEAAEVFADECRKKDDRILLLGAEIRILKGDLETAIRVGARYKEELERYVKDAHPMVCVEP